MIQYLYFMNDTDKQTIAWNFVEAHFPNFSSSDEIARNGDLTKISDGEYDEGDAAHQLLISEYNGDLNNHRIEIDLRTSFCGIYATAMEEAFDGSPWCFAAEYFPRYSYSELVYRGDLLQKIFEGGDCMNDDSEKMLRSEFGGHDSDPQIAIEMAKGTFTIFEGAILGFMAEKAREAKPSTVQHSSGTKVAG